MLTAMYTDTLKQLQHITQLDPDCLQNGTGININAEPLPFVDQYLEMAS